MDDPDGAGGEGESSTPLVTSMDLVEEELANMSVSEAAAPSAASSSAPPAAGDRSRPKTGEKLSRN